jgi:hypothetical protein
LAAQPRFLGASDESYYLYHSARMLAGEALYRDMSQLTTPFFNYWIALSYRLLGADMVTTHLARASLQAIIVGTIYVVCRAIRVRPALAWSAAAVHLAVSQPAWPHVTPHWLSSLLVCLLMLVSFDRRRATGSKRMALAGVLSGILVLTQQQRGVVFVIGIVLLVALDRFLGRRYDAPLSRALERALTYCATVVIVVFPVLSWHAVQTGFESLFYQLVVYPLTGYRVWNADWHWGDVGLLNRDAAKYTWVGLLKFLPCAVGVAALWAVIEARRMSGRTRVETPMVLAVFGCCSIISIQNAPDFIHIATIFPVILVICARILEEALVRIPGWSNWAGHLGAGALTLASGLHLQRNHERMREDFRFETPTAFGTVALHSREEMDIVARVRSLVDTARGREFFCYPTAPVLYLLSAADNPTRHDFMLPGLHRTEEVSEMLDTLDRRRVRDVFWIRSLTPPDDPFVHWLNERYDCTGDGFCVRRP